MNKKANKLICTFAIVALLFTYTASALEPLPEPKADVNNSVVFTVDDSNYSIGGQIKKADTAPYIQDGRVMLPIRYVAESLGIKEKGIEWDPKEQSILIFRGKSIIQLKIGDPILAISGRKIQMDVAPTIKNGRTVLPLSYIAEALGIKVKWNSYSRKVSFDLPSEAKELLSEEEKEKTDKKSEQTAAKGDYSYEELVALALDNSKELEKTKKLIDRNKIMRDEASDEVDYTPLSGTAYGPWDAAASYALMKVKDADTKREIFKQQILILEDALSYQVLENYYEIIKNEEKLEVVKKMLDLNKEMMELTRKKYEVGMASELENTKAKRSYEESKKTRKILEEKINNAYEKLNSMIGFEPDKRYELGNELAFREMKDVPLDFHIRRTLTESPPIRILEQQVNLADLGLRLYVYNAGMDPYAAREIDVKTTQLSLADTKQNFEKSIRNLYSSLKQLEDQHESLQIKLDKTIDDLKLVRANREVDMAIDLELKKVNLEIEDIKQQMRENIIEYEKVKMLYEKPWALQKASM